MSGMNGSALLWLFRAQAGTRSNGLVACQSYRRADCLGLEIAAEAARIGLPCSYNRTTATINLTGMGGKILLRAVVDQESVHKLAGWKFLWLWLDDLNAFSGQLASRVMDHEGRTTWINGRPHVQTEDEILARILRLENVVYGREP